MKHLHLPTIDIHSSLGVHDISPPNSGAPTPVQEHVASFSTLVDETESRGAVGPSAASFLREFANRHDAGYATDLGALGTDEAQAILKQALGETGASIGPRQVTEYLVNNQGNYLTARVIGHGVLGLVDNTLHYQAQGASFDQAFGLASVMAAHHPGFPITMVTNNFVSGSAAIRDHERSGFFIDNNGGEPEVMRKKLIDMAAEHLGVSAVDAARAAVLGYSFDRITPGKTPDAVRVGEDGRTTIKGGEVIQKKYGLVAGDLIADKTLAEPSIRELYATVIDRLQAEADAAIAAATYAGQEDIKAFIANEAQRVIAQTRDKQTEALAELDTLGLSGSFARLKRERAALLQAARKNRNPDTLYALASYDVVIPRVA